MDKNKVYELFFNTIAHSMEWASDYENYHKYVDGAVDITEKMLEYLGKKDGELDDETLLSKE